MFSLQPILSNELIDIRPLQLKDKQLLYDVASDPLIWEQHQVKDRWTRPGFDRFFEESIQSGGALVILDQATKQLIGSTRFNTIEANVNAIEIGWSFLSRNYWGGRYNRAVKTLIINYAFQYVGQVVFYINQNNIRSQKAVQKLGAVQVEDYAHQHPFMPRNETLIFIIDKIKWDKIQKL